MLRFDAVNDHDRTADPLEYVLRHAIKADLTPTATFSMAHDNEIGIPFFSQLTNVDFGLGGSTVNLGGDAFGVGMIDVDLERVLDVIPLSLDSALLDPAEGFVESDRITGMIADRHIGGATFFFEAMDDEHRTEVRFGLL